MKLATLLLIISLQVGAAARSQDQVTLHVQGASVEAILKSIARQTGFQYAISDAFKAQANKVDLNVKNANLIDVLELLFKDQPFTYEIINKIIVVKKKDAPKLVASEGPGGPGQPVEVTGQVLDENGRPLVGANVTIKETGKGTITNARGEFSFKVPTNGTLVVSYIGFAPEVRKVGVGSMKFILKVTKNELDKVVIQAYGHTTQRLATGNITTVTAAEIEKQPVMNVTQILQGKVAGLDIVQTSGYASAPFTVEIRGRSSLANVPSDPLYIIDGVPLTILEQGNSSYVGGSVGFSQQNFQGPAGGQNPLFSLNPSDIESVTVLKDADATAIYGSKGANGVIVITTKKAISGKARLEINFYQAKENPSRSIKLLNTSEYLKMRREAYMNDGYAPNPGDGYDLTIWDTTRMTDWEKYFWNGSGQDTKVQLSFSSGDKYNSLRMSGGYERLTEITSVKGSNQRGSLQFNASHKSTDNKLNLSFTNMFSVTDVDLANFSGSPTIPPNAPAIFNSEGKLNYRGWDPIPYVLSGYQSVINPYSSPTTLLNSNLTFSYEIVRGLKFAGNFGYAWGASTPQSLFTIASQDPLNNPTGSGNFASNTVKNWIIEPQFEYESYIGKGRLSVLLGGTSQAASGYGTSISANGFVNDALLQSISVAPSATATGYSTKYKYAAIFSRINYNWQDEFIINLTARRDGSSRFGPGKQYGNFGSVGGAWIFTEEGWFKNNLRFLSTGKIRASYGLVGSDQVGDYGYLSRWSPTGVIPYQGNASYVPLQLFNPDYHWQTNKKLEVALGLSFLQDRINTQFIYYRDRCGDQLINLPLASITGFGGVTANSSANVQNKGYEIELNARLIDNKDFSINFSFNTSRNFNKLLSYPNLTQSSFLYTYIVGQPLNLTYLLKYTGLDRQSGKYTFYDKNKDGQINPNVGPTSDAYPYDFSPKFFGGFGFNVRYKQFNISSSFFYRRWLLKSAYAVISPIPGGIGNIPLDYLKDYWKKPGDNATYARLTNNPQQSDFNFQSSTGAVSLVSMLRCSNLDFRYTIKRELLDKLHLNEVQIYATVQNLFLISNYNGIDPQTSSISAMPTPRSFALGFKLSL